MSQKPSRWHETLAVKKTNKPTQKNRGKELTALTVHASNGGKQTGSSAAKTSVSCGRSSSFSSKGGDSTASGSKFGGNRSNLSHQGSAGHQVNRQASHPARPTLRLRSSRSFSSLQATTLSAAPFMRSSRSLSRLDQRSADSDHTPGRSQVKKSQNTGKKILDSGRLSSSVEQISSSFPPQASSSSRVSTTVCHHDNNKEKKQTRDGVYTLCAMTSGMKRNWVQAVLKNVRPILTHDTTSALSEQKVEQLEELSTGEWAEGSQQQQPERTAIQQPEGGLSLADSSSLPPVSPAVSPPQSPTSPLHQVEEGEVVNQCQLPVEITETGVIESSSCDKGSPSGSSASKVGLSNHEDFEEYSNRESETERSLQQSETTSQKEEEPVSVSTTCECTEDKEALLFEQQTGQLVKELEQTQRELSRVQQLNRNLQDELQQEREIHSRKLFFPQNTTNSSSEHALAFQRLQRINHNLRMELDTLKRSQEEAREAELRRRVDLLAQQAQLLVTGDATALAQIQLEQDRQSFQEQRLEWEHSMTSLKSQLSVSEEKRKEAESHLNQLQQELEGQQNLQQDAEQLRKHLQDMSAQLRTYEEAQAEKEARLQKHLMLLQASQERERRSLAASLAQAEQHSQDLKDKLSRAEEQVDSLNKTQTWTREIEEAQQQLQEELACTVSAVQRLQEEREQLDHRCQELQSQLSEADREVSRLQDRLKTEETHFYNLEHSYERACEELLVALSKVQQRESETQDMREGYEGQLDRKEQELTEVLLKMEVLGNSLEETEVKLSEAMKVCICTSPQLRDETLESVKQEAEQQLISEPFTGNESRASMVDIFQLPNSSNVSQLNSSDPHEHARSRSGSVEASYQYNSTAGDDAEKFMSVIQLLETKLFVTEEKLRDITQGLEEHQGHISCQDPYLCSQLTQSRATAQHMSLLLHSQAKQSRRFAQETENRCRMLVSRFQAALNIIQASRERIHATPVNIPDLERKLAAVAACLQQGEKEAERVQRDSYNVGVEEDKILSDEKLAGAEWDIVSKLPNTWSLNDIPSAGKCLIRELFVVEKIVSFLQSQDGISCLASISRRNESDIARSYKNITSQRMALKTKERMESGRLDCGSDEALENIIGRVCAEAELIYAALKLQQQHESMTQESNEETGLQREGLADISPSELDPYDEQVKIDSRGSGEASKLVEEEPTDDELMKLEKERDWLERLVSRLQRRAEFLRRVYKDICNDNSPFREGRADFTIDNASTADLNCFQEQVKLIYLSDRLYLDLEQEFQKSELLQNKLQALCKEQDVNLMAEQEALNHALNQLQEDNNALKEELERAEENTISAETGNQKLLEDIQKIEDYHEERMQKLEAKFQKKITELQQIHEEEMKHLHSYYTKSCVSKDKQSKHDTETTHVTEESKDSSLLDQERKTKGDLDFYLVEPDAVAMKEAYLKDLEKLQASRDQGFAAMEEIHRKLIRDLQQQHQKQVAELLKEKDQLLQEETAATMAAIVAMRRAHKQELERSRWSQHIRESADVTELQMEYEKEIQLLHKELEVLSAQHTEKCLENSQLSQDLQDERKSVMHYQKENQELKQKQSDTDQMSPLHGNQSHGPPQMKNYQMELTLRAKEAEIQFLRQESRSLTEQLEIAGMDKVYMQNKLEALNTKDGAHQSFKDSKFATWSPNRDTSGQSLDDSATTTNKSAFAKKTEKSSFMRQIRGIRSKSLKDGLSLHERLKLFESF